jgi:arylsulfatase A
MKAITMTITAVAIFLASCVQEKKPDPPNIVFILADDMGYGDLSSYGATKIQTPNIDRLAEEGIQFTDGHCGASTCTPTRYGFLTGRYNFRTWLKYSALSTSAPLLIEEGRMTLASMMKEEGYTTSIVGKWHLGYGLEEGFGDNRCDEPPNYWETRGSGPDWNGELKPGPLECGFDYSYVIPVANSFPPYVIVEGHYVAGLQEDNPITNMVSNNYGLMEGGDEARWKDEELVDMFTEKLIAQLEGFAEEKNPFFLFYAPHQPHIPFRPHPRFAGTSQAGVYGDVIHELDWSVGELLDALDRLGFSENTLVIFSSDNGAAPRFATPTMNERARDTVNSIKRSELNAENAHRTNGPNNMRGGKGDLVEGGHRVPLLARWPGRIKPGTRSTETISLTDMLATFAALIGRELPPNAGEDSYNVLPALLGDKLPDPDRPLVFSSGGTSALSIRMGEWSFIDGQGDCGYMEFFRGKPFPEPAPGDPPGQLYNLDEDLGETNNLYEQHPEIVERLKQKLEEIKAESN